MIRSLFLYVSFIFCFISCSKTTPLPSNEKKLITEKVNQLYSQYGKSNEAVYNQPISNDLFSPELKKTLETAINASKADIEKVKNSDHPDEKPLIFEGAIFSSLYEGYTGYTIKSIRIHDKTAEALVQFEYNTAFPKESWTDVIQLIDTDKGWKIDNIIFDKKANHSKDLKTSLTDFIQYTKQ
ncbi:DUF3828 domain-containing protein [Chryseobacterium jejuense]|uniref:DUF3828 domain-containing protein n=1 Tax=Chryseobacterium jejuense TaxID=445960 RepID=A0A2X2VFN4_CHRJE|nr:DUF3828 domain-containing protein [Chryseobacterium jejuense]SDI91808.1 Protein of unknown function [Chryseobacterium jejuense]SQB27398.1 Uncharacterised protein [Chryseobacterium jejuense]